MLKKKKVNKNEFSKDSQMSKIKDFTFWHLSEKNQIDYTYILGWIPKPYWTGTEPYGRYRWDKLTKVH